MKRRKKHVVGLRVMVHRTKRMVATTRRLVYCNLPPHIPRLSSLDYLRVSYRLSPSTKFFFLTQLQLCCLLHSYASVFEDKKFFILSRQLISASALLNWVLLIQEEFATVSNFFLGFCFFVIRGFYVCVLIFIYRSGVLG